MTFSIGKVREGLDQSEIDRRMDAFREACVKAGMKLTHQRIEVFREVAVTEEHPDVETILARVRTRIPTISMDTVYRTLKTMERLKVVSRVTLFCEPARFDANMKAHHHLLCVRCGAMKDFSSPDMNDLPLPPEAQNWGEVKSVHVELRAVCSECMKQHSGLKKRN